MTCKFNGRSQCFSIFSFLPFPLQLHPETNVDGARSLGVCFFLTVFWSRQCQILYYQLPPRRKEFPPIKKRRGHVIHKKQRTCLPKVEIFLFSGNFLPNGTSLQNITFSAIKKQWKPLNHSLTTTKIGFLKSVLFNRGSRMLINKEGPTQSSIARHFLECGRWWILGWFLIYRAYFFHNNAIRASKSSCGDGPSHCRDGIFMGTLKIRPEC